MHQLEEVTQLNKATSQETHVASENLNEQVVQLSKVMENINEILKGQSENLSSTNLFRPQSKPDSKNPPPAKAFPKEESHPHFSSTG
jgi:DNA-binding protein H-NS